MLTVKEMLSMPPLKGLEIVAGKGGENRTVSTVSVMDALDIYRWMKGGEFLITSGSPVKEDPSYIAPLIEKLNENGASAFGIKTGRFLGSIPKEALDTADRLSFPLIYIPNEFAFTDIINPVLREVIDRQSRILAMSEKIHRSFTRLAITEQGVEQILLTLSRIIGRETAFYDLYFSRLFVPSGFELKEEIESLPNSDLSKDLTRYFDTYPVSNLSMGYGLIVMGKRTGETIDRSDIALEHAATILILDVQKRISNSQVESKFRDELVHDIIYANIKSHLELFNRSRLYGWDFSKGGVVVTVDIDDFKENYRKILDKGENRHLENAMNDIYLKTVGMVKNLFPTVAYSKLNDAIVFILSQSESEAARTEHIFEDVRKMIAESGRFTATIAIGRYKSDPMELYLSYEESKKCVAISRSLSAKNTVVLYDKLGLYKLVNLLLGTPEAEELLDTYIRPLIKWDGETGGELTSTFAAVCESGWNLKHTAERLFLHYNTAKYRYGRICSLLGTDFKDADERTQAEIAVRLFKMTSMQK